METDTVSVVIVCCCLLYLTFICLFPSPRITKSDAKFTEMPITRKNYTPKQLANFNGVTDEKIFMAVCGHVFDVSSGKAFYGTQGAYGNFAGRDSSRGLAMSSFGVEMLADLRNLISILFRSCMTTELLYL